MSKLLDWTTHARRADVDGSGAVQEADKLQVISRSKFWSWFLLVMTSCESFGVAYGRRISLLAHARVRDVGLKICQSYRSTTVEPPRVWNYLKRDDFWATNQRRSNHDFATNHIKTFQVRRGTCAHNFSSWKLHSIRDPVNISSKTLYPSPWP